MKWIQIPSLRFLMLGIGATLAFAILSSICFLSPSEFRDHPRKNVLRLQKVLGQ